MMVVLDGGRQLFSSAGHIVSLFESRGPHFSQKGCDKAKKIAFAGRMWPTGRMLPPPVLDRQVVAIQRWLLTQVRLPLLATWF